MKGFFGRMSFPRAVILFCTLGSIALAVLVYQRSQRLELVKAQLDLPVKELVQQIQTNADKLDDLQRRATNEKFKAQDQPESYIRGIAGQPNIDMGQLDFSKRTDDVTKGVRDTIYKISPQSKGMHYNRGQIGNFLYRLESDSPRVKVTRLKLTPFDKVSPGEVGKDRWNFEAEITTRTKTEDTQAAGAGGKG